jgi:ABC-type branched-subunit amino acid transport system permease subunit
MKLLGHLRLSFWIATLGAVVLYVFFVFLASIPIREVLGITAVIATLAALVTVHNLRVRTELADPGGDPRVRRSLNRQRERRGF